MNTIHIQDEIASAQKRVDVLMNAAFVAGSFGKEGASRGHLASLAELHRHLRILLAMAEVLHDIDLARAQLATMQHAEDRAVLQSHLRALLETLQRVAADANRSTAADTESVDGTGGRAARSERP